METKLIHKKMIEVMKKVSAISKGKRNTAQNYSFRGIDDVYNELHDTMAEIGVFVLPSVLEDRHEERTTKSGGLSIYRVLKIKYIFMAEDGSSVECVVIGEGMDSGDKASNKAQSVAQKYALIQTFLIPTEEAKDPENDSHDLVPDSFQVGTNVNALFALLKTKAIPVDLFTGFLRSKKEIGLSDDIRHLSEPRAKIIIDNWETTERLLKAYGDK